MRNSNLKHKYRRWGTIRFNIPELMQYATKTGKLKEAQPITKTGAIATRNSEKAIKLDLKKQEDLNKQQEKFEYLKERVKSDEKFLDTVGKRATANFIEKIEKYEHHTDRHYYDALEREYELLHIEIRDRTWGKYLHENEQEYREKYNIKKTRADPYLRFKKEEDVYNIKY